VGRTRRAPNFPRVTTTEIRLTVEARDAVSRAGLTALLREAPGVTVVADGDVADVRLVVCPRFFVDVAADLRSGAARSQTPVVLVIDRISEPELISATECRVVAVLPRHKAGRQAVLHAVRAAATGGSVMPPELVGHLLRHLVRLQGSVLAPREIEVLRLLAAGHDTFEVAGSLSYSPRTVKKIVRGIYQRLSLKNRTHAVAYAMRSGII
jgi:DNA-binding NarL/FixJ family response regulator